MKNAHNTSSPLFLLFHLFALIPSIIFMILYAKYSLFSLVMVMILTMLFSYNFYRYRQSLSPLYRPVLMSFVGAFLLYGFTALGSNNTPKTFDMLYANESVTLLHLKEASPIDKLCYYVGIDYNSFEMEYKVRNQWKHFYHYKLDYPFSFRWKCQAIRISQTDTLLLRPTEHEKLQWSTDNDLMIGEIRLFYKEKLLPYTTKAIHLNDEPNTTIDKTYYAGMFFDEIYHGRSAYEISNDLPLYGNVHPYLGKTLLIPGIKIFGMTPFGWRFDNTLFAIILIFSAYYFGLLLFKKPLYAFGATILITYSFMHLVQSRLAHIDTFGVTFTFLSYFYLYQFITKEKLKPLFISGIFFGLGSAVKWSAVFSSLGFLFILLYLIITKHNILKRFSSMSLIKYGLLTYAVLAPFVYLLTFYDLYFKTGSLQTIIDYNTNMYNYNTTLVATHPYSSPWWTWPFDWKPMGYYKQYNGTLVSSINVFGNPAIFWVGILALLYSVFSIIKNKSLEAAFLFFAFLGLFIPYLFVGRLMFIYHFYYAAPFMMLTIIYMFKSLIDKHSRFLIPYIIYLAIVISIFLLFYPVLSGIEVEKDFVQHYLIWLPKWWL